jgi:hypothetical protein
MSSLTGTALGTRLARFVRKPLPDKMSAVRATVRDILRDDPRRVPGLNNLEIIQRRLDTLTIIQSARYLRELLADSRYADPKRLERYGFKVYSQNDEDGIIEQIFKRIGITSKTFVEFGVENGLENNTLRLLLEGWSGLWIESSEGHVGEINRKFSDVVANGRLRVIEAVVDRDNINTLIGTYCNGEIDFLSIDIDGNDIYILEAIDVVNPRVIVVEYNGKFRPPLSVAQRYDPTHKWSGTDYGGASLAAITKVADRKGYNLVGCGIVGVNAFLVRKDLVKDKFQEPFTAVNHYQPARYFLWQTFASGHSPDWGPYEAV